MRFTIALLFLSFILAVGCTEDPGTIHDKGTVTYMQFEGGFYGIITDKGDRYLPENLSPDFQKDGLRVYFEGVILTNVATTVMWGRPFNVTRIQIIQ